MNSPVDPMNTQGTPGGQHLLVSFKNITIQSQKRSSRNLGSESIKDTHKETRDPVNATEKQTEDLIALHKSQHTNGPRAHEKEPISLMIGKAQVTASRGHRTPTWMAKIKKTDRNQVSRDHGTQQSHPWAVPQEK